jgi:chromosome partitioning protein
VPRLQVFTRAANIDVLVVDAPGWADASTLWLAQGSQLVVLPTGGTVDDLNPTIRLMHELMNKGIADWRLSRALCRIHTDAQAEFARGYLKQANYKALGGSPELAALVRLLICQRRKEWIVSKCLSENGSHERPCGL